MASEVKLPELGENIESGTISKILVAVGDQVEKDQAIIELETDKAVVEVPADRSGKVKEIAVKEGDELKVGQKIIVLEDGAPEKKDTGKEEKEAAIKAPEAEKGKESLQEKKSAGEKQLEAKPQKKSEEKQERPAKSTAGEVKTFQLPELGENVNNGTVTKILVSPGDSVETDQNVVELETEKAVVEIPVDFAGMVKEVFVKEGDEIKIGQKILSLSVGEETPTKVEEKPQREEKEDKTAKTAEKEQPEKKEEDKPETKEAEEMAAGKEPPRLVKREGEPAPAAPSVRRFAREIGVDINEVPGSGPSGRISVEDVKQYSKTLNTGKAASRAVLAGVEPETLPDFTKWGSVEREPMNKVREKTARHLGFAWATIPHVTQFDRADITSLEDLRRQYGKQVEKAGGKLTVTAILLKISAAALLKFPRFNASIDMENNEIIYKKYINIGIAVDTDRGLLVPVVRNVDRKNITELSVELTQLAQKARDRKLSLDELQGGNFSISNLGGIGGTSFTPVVNSPEVAVLGVSRSEMQPQYLDGTFRPRLMLPLSLSYDHRLVDGADAARFLRWVAEALENPFKILLEG
jgi:pyruvate dehydrogenase E2 component (dihydrolipoamide acetyltransferase)